MVVFYISYVFLVLLLKTVVCLSYICHLACITLKFVYSALFYFLCIAAVYLFHELLDSIGGFERYSYVVLFGKICNFPYSWTVVCESGPYFVFISAVFI